MSVLTRAASHAGGIVLGETVNVATEAIRYAANYASQISIPAPGELIACMTHGFLNSANGKHMLAFHGINTDVNAWQAVIDFSRAYPGPDEAVLAFHRGAVAENVADRWMQASGFTGGAENGYMWGRPHMWTPDESRTLNAIGKIDGDKYGKYLRAAGLLLPEDRENFYALHRALSWSETMDAWNRNYIDELTADKWLSLEGINNSSVRDVAKLLRYKLPSPSELIEFSVKEVWNREIVERFGYDDEFDQIPEFRHFMQQTGYGGPATPDNGAPGGPETWAQAWWRAHWRVVSNEQAYRMLHRLRPTGGPNGGPRMPVVPGTGTRIDPVTIRDVEGVLKVNDYPPYWRDKLAALSFNVLRLVDIRRIVKRSLQSEAFKQEAIGDGYSIKDWAKENFLDRGQTPQDAETLAVLSIADAQDSIDTSKKRIKARVDAEYLRNSLAMYRLGTITRQQAKTRLAYTGMSLYEQDATLDRIDEQNSLACVNAALKLAQRNFVKGVANEDATRAALKGVGIVAEASDRYIACWRLSLHSSRIMAYTREVQAQLAEGLITYSQALDRLTNLGWENGEAILEVAEMENDMSMVP